MKYALKIWNAIELAHFLKANNLKLVVADVEATSDDCETQQRCSWKRKSKSLKTGEKPKSAKTPTAEPRSQASVLRTPTTACFSSAFKELIFNSLSFSKTNILMIGMIRTIA